MTVATNIRLTIAGDEEGFVAYQRKCQAEIAASNECYKCAGKGRIRGFGHIEGGKCFACGGTGKRRIS